jgi:hypothetical protein
VIYEKLDGFYVKVMNMSKEDVLNSIYISAKELKILMPQKSIESCRNIIMQVRKIMKEKKQFCPPGKPYIALTSEVKDFLGIR